MLWAGIRPVPYAGQRQPTLRRGKCPARARWWACFWPATAHARVQRWYVHAALAPRYPPHTCAHTHVLGRRAASTPLQAYLAADDASLIWLCLRLGIAVKAASRPMRCHVLRNNPHHQFFYRGAFAASPPPPPPPGGGRCMDTIFAFATASLSSPLLASGCVHDAIC